MLSILLNKKVTVWIAFLGYMPNGGATPEKIKGILTGYDDEFIVIDKEVLVSKKYLIKIQPL